MSTVDTEYVTSAVSGRQVWKYGSVPGRVGLATMLLRVFQAHHVVLQALLPACVVALIEGIDLA